MPADKRVSGGREGRDMAKRQGQVAEAEIRVASEDLAAAVRAKDVDRLMAHYAPDVRSFGIGQDVAFAHSLDRVQGVKSDGTKVDMWWRSTVGYRRIDGRGSSPTATIRCRSTWRAVEP
jgi:ketosteroid isomerase-like protein